jgi:glycosyltransferase involved in cell wall biosynthesis
MILFIGRLTEVKGVDVLLRAMSCETSARLVIAGDGNQRSCLEALACELALDATFLGQVDARERNRLLAECEAVVIPSRVLSCGRTEGAPVVCLEAMAAGRPVIASRVGGLAEIIVDGQNGLLFEAGDESALGKKLSLLIGNSSLSGELATNARLTAARHSWPLVGSRFAEVITASLNKDDRVLDDQEPGRSFA